MFKQAAAAPAGLQDCHSGHKAAHADAAIHKFLLFLFAAAAKGNRQLVSCCLVVSFVSRTLLGYWPLDVSNPSPSI
jgi:hypothetical protein